MAFSLYAATIPSYQQILGSVSGLLVKAEAFCAEKSINHEDIIQARLAPDMLPFAYHVKSTAVHSLGAIEGVRRGTFSPDMSAPPETFAALKARMTETLAALEKIEPSEVDGFVGRDMRFAFRDRQPQQKSGCTGAIYLCKPSERESLARLGASMYDCHLPSPASSTF